jgi:uncharacterized alpha-E superfamily protein
MLSRTAANLYWLSRNMERAECLARILDATHRLTSLPQSESQTTNEWDSAIATAACADAFRLNYEQANEQTVTEFLALSPYNPASIRNCLETARQNARAVRTALTVEMWDAINGAWHELKTYEGKRLSRDDFSRFLTFVKQASLAYDGSAYRTMLRNDGYWFSRLGILVERADATARILDVKYHVLLPKKEPVGGQIDYFQWASILRSVSALTSYYWVYKESVKPWLVADLLILNHQMPRSLASCYENLCRYLDDLAQFYGRQGNSQRLARAMLKKLSNTSVDEIFQSGLHEFIQNFIGKNNGLGNAITEQYLT